MAMLTNPTTDQEPQFEDIQVENQPDGTSVYEKKEITLTNNLENQTFGDNLAKYLNDSDLNEIAQELLEGIQEDDESRLKWKQTYKNGLELLGTMTESSDEEKSGDDSQSYIGRKVYDTTLLTALLTFYSNVRSELFKEKGMASYKIIGEKTEEVEQKAERIKQDFNNYLSQEDKGYFPDCNRMLMPLGLSGCIFKKIYEDPLTGLPRSRFIDPENFIVNNQCGTLLESQRMSERRFLSKKEIILNIDSGIFIEHEIPGDSDEEENIVKTTIQKMDGIVTDSYNKPLTFSYFECYASLDNKKLLELENNAPNYPIPYIVFICEQTKKVVGIFRDWEEKGTTYTKNTHFVQYNYFTGFGLYGYGLLHILGSNVEAQTQILNQLITAGVFANFPGGFVAKGLRSEHDNQTIQPGQFIPVETGQLPIDQVFRTLPYKEPSIVLKELLVDLRQQTQVLGSVADPKIAENNNNAPVGTTLALIEMQNRLPSAVMRSLYNSLCEELDLLYKKLLRKIFNSPFTNVEEIERRIKIIPACDPSLDSSIQRIVKNESTLRVAQTAPQLHNMREVYKRFYLAMGIDEVDKILLPEQNPLPLDPITENMNCLNGKPLKAAIWQDHPSHILAHQVFSQQSPEATPILMAHIKEHQAMQYFIEMQMQMGMQMPMDEQQLMNPEIQNMIAIKVAQVASQQQQAQQQQQPPTLEQIALEEVHQKRESAQLKAETDRESNQLKSELEKMRLEFESYKTQLNYELEKQKLESEEEREKQKAEIDLLIAQLKTQPREEISNENL